MTKPYDQNKVDALASAKLMAANPYGRTTAELANNLTTPLKMKTGTAFDDPNYTPWDSVAHELITGRNDEVDKAVKETRKYIRRMKRSLPNKKQVPASRLTEANAELLKWLSGLLDARMEKIETSKWATFQDCVYNDNIFTSGVFSDNALAFVEDEQPQIFLMQHEWAKVLGNNASDEKGKKLDLTDFRLPYQRCIFELKIAGRRMLVLMDETDKGEIRFIVCIECNDCWFIGDQYPFSKFIKEYVDTYEEKFSRAPDNYVLDNVAAMCICLEANVIEVEVTRAPHKLNVARAKQGKTLLPAHNTVSLHRRYRVTNPTERTDSAYKGTVRMHFRRGHWRHYEQHKTWIKWMLVGNPDLGFVEHEYRA